MKIHKTKKETKNIQMNHSKEKNETKKQLY